MHSKPAQVGTPALNTLLAVQHEAVAVEECSCSKTGVRRHSRRTDRLQRRLDAMAKSAGNTATSECGMSEEKVEVAVVGVRSKTREHAIRLGDEGMKLRQALLPSGDIGRDWRPRGELFW